MTADIIARGLANMVRADIADGALPYDRSTAYSDGTIGKKLQEQISARDFGAVGDGVADDTAALQAFVNYLAINRRFGHIPAGTFRITSPIATYRTDSWGFRGAGIGVTIIRQDTDNVAILDLGGVTSSGSGYMYSTFFEGFTLKHKNVQTGNTSARGMVFSGMVFNGTMSRIRFERSYCGIYVAAGINPPWGNTWSDFHFVGSLTGSAMDWSASMIIGVPNNDWTRMTVECNGLTQTAFKTITGSNCRIGAIEFLGNVGTNPAGGTGNQLISFRSGSSFVIDCMKLETFNFTGSQSFEYSALISLPSATLQMGEFLLIGNQSVFNTSSQITIFGGPARMVNLGFFASGLSTVPANVTISGLSAGCNTVECILADNPARNIPLTNIGGSTGSNVVAYGWNSRPRLSDDIGNADYTVASSGGANIIIAQTALTAPRTVEIMADTNFLFNGYRIKVISRGAVNGANTLVIKAGGNTKATISSDNYAVELVWRRNATAHNGWVVVQQGAA